jgi:hypothetical protein
VAVDHREACSHVAGGIEGGDAGTKREARECMPEIEDAAERLEPSCALSRFLGPVAEVVQVAVAAAR